MESYYSQSELGQLGFASYGKNVLVSKKASIYAVNRIKLGNNVRIDDFCILSGSIQIGNYVHIAAYTALYGGEAGIQIQDFANISSRVSIYARSDDYSGGSLTNPLIPDALKHVTEKKVIIPRHCIIGTNSVVLPDAEIGDGCAFGAFSLIDKSIPEWTINVGIPCRAIKERKKDILELEQRFIKESEPLL